MDQNKFTDLEHFNTNNSRETSYMHYNKSVVQEISQNIISQIWSLQSASLRYIATPLRNDSICLLSLISSQFVKKGFGEPLENHQLKIKLL